MIGNFFRKKEKPAGTVAQGVCRRSEKRKRRQAVIGKLIRVTAGGRHGYYESDCGIIRKPLKNY